MITHASSEKNWPPIRLSRSSLLLRRLHTALPGRDGKNPTYKEMEEWTGFAEGTIKDWFNNRGRPAVEFLLLLMERVPEKLRHGILESAFKSLPALDSARLKCEQTIMSQLRSVASQRNGISFVTGGTGEARTFLVSALGNEFLGCTQRPCRVSGFDVHEPDWFVPVPGVKYLHNQFQPALLRKAIQQEWAKLETGGTQLIILNGLWSALPELQKEILNLAVSAPVIVADATIQQKPWPKHRQIVPVNIISVSMYAPSGTSFSVTIKSL